MPRDPNNLSNLFNANLYAPLDFLLDDTFLWKVWWFKGHLGEVEGRRGKRKINHFLRRYNKTAHSSKL
jgi:hypothetical protein